MLDPAELKRRFGKYVVESGTVWVASSLSPRSFDSRYFGPVQMNQVRERVRPLLTFDNEPLERR